MNEPYSHTEAARAEHQDQFAKAYRGNPRTHTVTVTTGLQSYPLQPRPYNLAHSDAFAWGRSGSAVTELAWCILADWRGEDFADQWAADFATELAWIRATDPLLLTDADLCEWFKVAGVLKQDDERFELFFESEDQYDM
jgi:hypothetical protein